jgi:hypothetical protein
MGSRQRASRLLIVLRTALERSDYTARHPVCCAHCVVREVPRGCHVPASPYHPLSLMRDVMKAARHSGQSQQMPQPAVTVCSFGISDARATDDATMAPCQPFKLAASSRPRESSSRLAGFMGPPMPLLAAAPPTR